MKTLNQITNASTGSIFHTIATHESGLIGSLRIFLEKGAQKNHTIVAFRFRVESALDMPVVANLSFALKSIFPNANWNGKGDTHHSLAGALVVDRPMWNIDEVLATLAKTFSFPLLWDRLGYEFPNFTWLLTKDEFIEFFTGQVTSLLTTGLADGTSAVPGVIFNFGSYQKLLSSEVQTAPDHAQSVIQAPAEEPDYAVLQAPSIVVEPAPASENGATLTGPTSNGVVINQDATLTLLTAPAVQEKLGQVLQSIAPEAKLTPAQKAAKAMGFKGIKSVKATAINSAVQGQNAPAMHLEATGTLSSGQTPDGAPSDDSSGITNPDVGL